ncbi:Glycerol-3-phosphate acyltransferase 3 [Araneus ventricosus]|uniref:Glycerol-3-phosphate acyltransferase 3 n=1 Tax=Araneus ventricosus TaxID=182803 RepID=A0A4Y2BLH3_ARAVE|nr:Glycerol-3-phosphate acyltransferase 3 [Araneus ventricosus]
MQACPRGGILAPYIFVLFMNDIPQQRNITLSLYADDTAILAQGKTPEQTLTPLQNYVIKLEAWLVRWKIKLNVDKTEAIVGQTHSGFLGLLQRALARATSHVWFERFEMKDRSLVTKRLREHCQDSSKLPILIFPEGTCINNTSVMMFKKGSFEVGGTIYPAAIKYDPRFGDPFWNSSKQGYGHYLLMMMSSWAIVCDVWYLPPMQRQEGESSIDFAKRVKAVISKQGGLVDLEWDGQLKRMQVKKEWKELQQQEYSRKIMGD